MIRKQPAQASSLDLADSPNRPDELFATWFDHAQRCEEPLPQAVALATSSPDGAPSVRAVLMKDHGPDGLTFFSNAESRKGADLAANPRAALCFVWKVVDRQVRLEGTVRRVPDEVVDDYWVTRPPRARAGAAVSPQSRVIESRESLLGEVLEIEARHPDGVPRPPHWVGWQVLPTRWEFWQGRPDRLHDRLQYTTGANGEWERQRLAP